MNPIIIHAFGANGEYFHTAAPKISVMDTVGAGDTFQAGLIHEIFQQGGVSNLDNLDAAKLIKFAAHAAAVTCERNGGDLPTLADIAARFGDLS